MVILKMSQLQSGFDEAWVVVGAGGGGLLPSKRQERMSCKRLYARRLFVCIQGKDKFGRARGADFQVGGLMRTR